MDATASTTTLISSLDGVPATRFGKDPVRALSVLRIESPAFVGAEVEHVIEVSVGVVAKLYGTSH